MSTAQQAQQDHNAKYSTPNTSKLITTTLPALAASCTMAQFFHTNASKKALQETYSL
jgi:hypothetical protein